MLPTKANSTIAWLRSDRNRRKTFASRRIRLVPKPFNVYLSFS
jgi:hypothetical protein